MDPADDRYLRRVLRRAGVKRQNFWHGYTGYLLCRALGHSFSARMMQRGSEECDCGANHTYLGCIRCRTAVDE